MGSRFPGDADSVSLNREVGHTLKTTVRSDSPLRPPLTPTPGLGWRDEPGPDSPGPGGEIVSPDHKGREKMKERER